MFLLLLGSIFCSKSIGIKGQLSSALNLIYTYLFFPHFSFPVPPIQMITTFISKEKQGGGKEQFLKARLEIS